MFLKDPIQRKLGTKNPKRTSLKNLLNKELSQNNNRNLKKLIIDNNNRSTPIDHLTVNLIRNSNSQINKAHARKGSFKMQDRERK